MMSGGNWWRANEIVVIRHHSRESETAKVPVSIPLQMAVSDNDAFTL
jgi:hypothetical protein